MLCCCRQLKVLRLGWNMLGPKGAKALAEGLKYCSSGLEQLYLPWSGITDTGASHIAKVCVTRLVTYVTDTTVAGTAERTVPAACVLQKSDCTSASVSGSNIRGKQLQLQQAK
jgi:hypothetical protein